MVANGCTTKGIMRHRRTTIRGTADSQVPSSNETHKQHSSGRTWTWPGPETLAKDE